MQVQKNYNAQGLRGCQHALRKLRTKAKGRRMQTEGDEEDLSPSWEERKDDR